MAAALARSCPPCTAPVRGSPVLIPGHSVPFRSVPHSSSDSSISLLHSSFSFRVWIEFTHMGGTMPTAAVPYPVGECSNPAVALMRQLVSGGPDASGTTFSRGWNRCWEEGVTPWDLGQPTPAVVHLVSSGTLPGAAGGDHTTTVLVPGCGAGHDVVALSGAGRFAIGLDISETVVQKAKQRTATAAAADGKPSSFDFVAADFFTWEPPEKFDLIFDYTFFLAIDPSMRPAWAKRTAELLKPDGELVTLMYLLEGQQEAGPPFNNAVVDYEEVLNPLGFVMNSIQDNEVAVQSRKGMEKIARWKRMTNPTSLDSAGETKA